MNWSPFMGVLLVLYAVYVIYKGRITVSDEDNRSSGLNRSEKPVQFWFSVFVLLVMAALLIFNVFHF